MRAILLLLLALPLFGACPTSTDDLGEEWATTCFVSLTGSDTAGVGLGTWSAPVRTVNRAAVIAAGAAGTKILVRGGRWTTNSDTLFSSANQFSCPITNLCTIGGYPREVFIMDASNWGSAGVFIASDDPRSTDTPPYSTDPADTIPFDGWIISNIRVENAPRQWIWLQSQASNVHMRNIRYHGSMGWTFYNCEHCSMTNIHMEIEGTNPALGPSQGHGIDCTPSNPNQQYVPWKGIGQAAYGNASGDGVPNYWQLTETSPSWPDMKSLGCKDFLIDAFSISRTTHSGSDLFGIEQGVNIVAVNSRFRAPKYVYSGTDSFDIKGYNVTMRNIFSLYGKNGIKAWGKFDIGGLFASNTLYPSPEMSMTFSSSMGTLAGFYPSSADFNSIHWAGNDDDGNAWVVFGDASFGNGPAPGQIVDIEDVPGCTSINKTVRVKPDRGSYNNEHNVMPLENLDGSQLSCNAPYDDSSQNIQTHAVTATFTGGGSANITLATAIPSTGTWSRPTSKLNNRVRFTTTGTLPTGLTPGADYYLKSHSGTTITVTATAQAGTGGSAAITFSDTGSGTHTATVLDDYTSYRGKMKTPSNLTYLFQDWGAIFKRSTVVSKSGSTMDIGQNIVVAGYSGRGFIYDFQKIIGYAKRDNTITPAEMYFGGPRVIANTTDNYLYLAYYDAGTMAVDDRVSIRCSAIPEALGPPAPLVTTTEYWVVASDSSPARIQVSTAQGGGAIDITSAGTGKCWAMFPGLSTEYIELDTLQSVSTHAAIASGNTFKIDSQGNTKSDFTGQPPYPFDNTTTYTVTDTTTATPNGTSVPLIRVNTGGGNITHTSRTKGPHWLVRTNATGTDSKYMAIRGPYTQRHANTANNQYYTGGAAGSAMDRIVGDPGYPGAIANTAELVSLEGEGSCIENPALDLDTGRATASTGLCSFDKGYYSFFHKLISKADTTAIIYNKFPAPCRFETCTLVVDDDADMLSPVETITITSGGQDQFIKVGETTPLTANTTYYYGWQQGYDTGGTSFTTDATLSGTGTLTNYIGPIVTSASVAYGLTPSLGTAGDTETTCASNCSLITTGIPKGTYYYQVTHDGVADAIKLITIKE